MSKLKKALAKANEIRESTPTEQIQRPVEAQIPSESTGQNKIPPVNGRQGLSINYSVTQIRKIDPAIFKKNKLVSYFPDFSETDQIKTLRTQVLKKLKAINGNTFMVTSANPQEGKTFMSINLGISIAQELDKSVLLIDADMSRPSKKHLDFSNDFFGVEFKTGLSDYLQGQAEIPDLLINPGVNKLTILPAGGHLPNSTELLSSPMMETLINEMKNRYPSDRIIIIDTPSLLKCADPLVLSPFADGILLVVEINKTTDAELSRAMDFLKDKHILGTVINKLEYS